MNYLYLLFVDPKRLANNVALNSSALINWIVPKRRHSMKKNIGLFSIDF